MMRPRSGWQLVLRLSLVLILVLAVLWTAKPEAFFQGGLQIIRNVDLDTSNQNTKSIIPFAPQDLSETAVQKEGKTINRLESSLAAVQDDLKNERKKVKDLQYFGKTISEALAKMSKDRSRALEEVGQKGAEVAKLKYELNTIKKERKNFAAELQGLKSELSNRRSYDSFSNTKKRPRKWQERMHLVFSTDCEPFQNWQSLILTHSAIKVGQPGKLTRLVAGCGKDQHKIDLARKSTLSPAQPHFTPSYARHSKLKDHYPMYNRPYGLRHWLDSEDNGIKDDTIIVILDPDFLFLRPISVGGATGNDVIFTGQREDRPTAVETVSIGKPLSQFYGIGDQWINWETTKKLCPDYPFLCNTTSREAWYYYSVGAPYILLGVDLPKVVDRWIDVLTPVRIDHPGLLSDMYAWAIATRSFNMPHTRLDSFIVSNVGGYGEAWNWILDIHKKLKTEGISEDTRLKFDACYSQNPISIKHVPSVIHFCQRYLFDYKKGSSSPRQVSFYKRFIPRDIMSCDASILELPPKDMFMQANSKEEIENAFMLCNLVPGLNAALISYKKRWCKDGYRDIADYRVVAGNCCGADGAPSAVPADPRI